MSSITIRFIRDKGLVSDAIAFTTNSLFSHVEFGTPDGTWLGAHAGGDGIQERPADYCSPALEMVYAIPCTDEQVKGLLTWARSKVGTPYNYEDIIGLLVHDRLMNQRGRDICSEFCFVGLQQIGINMLNVQVQY
jgi:hypothetical protein